MSTLRKKLFERCKEILAFRVAETQDAIRQLQASANEETKSSAGDKYETGRAMAQLEIEKLGAQLHALQQLLHSLDAIDVTRTYAVAQPGSLVSTNQGMFFVAVSLGKVSVEDADVMVISLASPIGKLLHGRRTGDTFSLNNRLFIIESVV